MTHLKAVWLFFAAFLIGLAQSQELPWLDRQFSVEVVTHDVYLDEVETGQLFVGDRQMRLEMAQEGEEGHPPLRLPGRRDGRAHPHA
jgi:hypothetical protein